MRFRAAIHRRIGMNWQQGLAFCLAVALIGSTVADLHSQDAVKQVDAIIESPAKIDAVGQANDAFVPLFVDWPKPKAAILFSGEMDGYLEPCGCAGLENQKGGLKRRQTFIRQLESQGWPLLSFDMGGQVRRLGPQAQIKFHYALKSDRKSVV